MESVYTPLIVTVEQPIPETVAFASTYSLVVRVFAQVTVKVKWESLATQVHFGEAKVNVTEPLN